MMRWLILIHYCRKEKTFGREDEYIDPESYNQPKERRAQRIKGLDIENGIKGHFNLSNSHII